MKFNGMGFSFKESGPILRMHGIKTLAIIPREVADERFPRNARVRNILIPLISDEENNINRVILTSQNAEAILRLEYAQNETEFMGALEELMQAIININTIVITSLGDDETKEKWATFKEEFPTIYVKKLIPEIANMVRDLFPKQ